eukprot:6491789-Amphidinium_carterae.2
MVRKGRERERLVALCFVNGFAARERGRGTDWCDTEQAEIGRGVACDLLSSAAYEVAAVKRGLCDHAFSNWKAKFALANITQTSEWSKQHCTDGSPAPALLRRSLLVDMVSSRALTIEELWLVQGYAHPLVHAPMRAKDAFLLADALESLTRAQQKSLLGNAMHLGQ